MLWAQQELVNIRLVYKLNMNNNGNSCKCFVKQSCDLKKTQVSVELGMHLGTVIMYSHLQTYFNKFAAETLLLQTKKWDQIEKKRKES